MLKKRIIPLLKIVGIDTKMIEKISDLGIDTAEELVALAATPGGLQGMAKYLGQNEQTVKKLVEDSKKKLPKELSHRWFQNTLHPNDGCQPSVPSLMALKV